MDSLCSACLCAERKLESISTEYLERALPGLLFEAASERALLVCWECSARLRRVVQFREQVQECLSKLAAIAPMLNRLNTYDPIQICEPSKLSIASVSLTTYPETDVAKQSNIIISRYHIKEEAELDQDDFNLDFSIDDIKEEFEEPAPKKRKKEKRKKRKKKTEEDSDCELLSLLKLKNEKAVSEKLKKKKVIKLKRGEKKMVMKRQKVQLDPEKIRKVILTQQELSMERLKETQKQSYLKLPFKCVTCIQGFDHEDTLRDHNERKHCEKVGAFVCPTCNSVLSTPSSYKTHRRRHLLRYECMACQKRTVDKISMLKHYSTEHEGTSVEYECQICGAVSHSYRSHRYHKEKHKEKPQCEDCGKRFINRATLRSHILNMHRTQRRLACSLCDKTYRGRSGLAMHMASHGARDAHLTYCPACQIHFKSAQSYQNHLRTSLKHITRDDLTHRCAECDMRFLTKRRLQEHVDWEHLKSAQHYCDACDKAFKHRVGLERHRKFVHEKLRPPRNKICHHCGRGFTTASILRSHIRTHTGERPLQCASCPATFSHSAALYTHNKLLHLKIKRD